jgi:hypothetical protein
MADHAYEESAQEISVRDLSVALKRPEALVRLTAKSFDLAVKTGCVSLDGDIALIRCFSDRSFDQDELLATQTLKLQAAKGRELELAIALEMVKQERSSLEKQANVLSEQLDRTNRRSDRLEQKLHDLTASFAHLVSQRDRLVAQTQTKSKTTLQWRNGKAVLLLEEPVNRHVIDRVDH